MRTTVHINDELLATAQLRARERHTTLGEVINTALRQTLFDEPEVVMPPLDLYTVGGSGPAPGMDLSSTSTLLDVLDEDLPPRSDGELLDANVLIALHRRDHPAHVVATAWIERQLEAVTALGVPITSVVALVRICANRRSYPVPSTQADAFTFLDRLLKHPLMQVVHPGPRHLALPSALCQDYDVRGPMVTDAHIAALAAERGASVVTFDRDFARFTRVRWENPAD